MALSHSHLGKEVPISGYVFVYSFIVVVDPVTQTGLKLVIPLPQLPKCCDGNATSLTFKMRLKMPWIRAQPRCEFV